MTYGGGSKSVDFPTAILESLFLAPQSSTEYILYIHPMHSHKCTVCDEQRKGWSHNLEACILSCPILVAVKLVSIRLGRTQGKNQPLRTPTLSDIDFAWSAVTYGENLSPQPILCLARKDCWFIHTQSSTHTLFQLFLAVTKGCRLLDTCLKQLQNIAFRKY